MSRSSLPEAVRWRWRSPVSARPSLSDAYRGQYGFDSCAPIVANLYEPGDNFDLEDSHVVAAMIRRYVEAHDRAARLPGIVDIDHGSPRETQDLEDLGFARAPQVRGYRPAGALWRQRPF